ncbi:YdcH family protein [Roseibium sp. LAB1]
MAQMDSEALRIQLAQLRQEHRDLDAAVEALASTSIQDALQLQRLKKKKLMIKDRITALEDQLFPDIIA